MKKKFVETIIEIVYFEDCLILTGSGGLEQNFEGEDDEWH